MKHLRNFLLLLSASGCVETTDTDTHAIRAATADTCESVDAPCVISLAPSETPPLYTATYRLCCPSGTAVEISILEVTSKAGNWGDVTRWGLCDHTYSEEFTHPLQSGAFPPWAILSTYDGNGGEITSCRTANAPLD